MRNNGFNVKYRKNTVRDTMLEEVRYETNNGFSISAMTLHPPSSRSWKFNIKYLKTMQVGYDNVVTRQAALLFYVMEGRCGRTV